jgi:hypothetical protein
MRSLLWRFFCDNAGATAIEYALIAGIFNVDRRGCDLDRHEGGRVLLDRGE